MTRGDRMRQARDEKGMTRQIVANQLGVAESTVRNIEVGRTTRVDHDYMVRFAALVEKPLEFFDEVPA